MATPTPLEQLVEQRLGESLQEFVRQRRQPCKSWRQIAAEVSNLTGVSVTHETVRRWNLATAPEVVEQPI